MVGSERHLVACEKYCGLDCTRSWTLLEWSSSDAFASVGNVGRVWRRTLENTGRVWTYKMALPVHCSAEISGEDCKDLAVQWVAVFLWCRKTGTTTARDQLRVVEDCNTVRSLCCQSVMFLRLNLFVCIL